MKQKNEQKRLERRRFMARKNYLKKKTTDPMGHVRKLENCRKYNKELREETCSHEVLMTVFDPDVETGRISRNEYTHKIGYKFGNYKGKTYWISRLIMMAAVGHLLPDDLEVMHKDKDKGNNRIENLELTTRKKIMEHASATGFMRNSTLEKKREFQNKIIKLHDEGLTTQVIADMTNRHQTSISGIIRGIFQYSTV